MAPSAWSVEDVAAWASRQPIADAEAVAASLRAEEVDGATLLSYASRDRKELKDDFSLTIGKANKLFSAICELAGGGSGADTASPPSSPSEGVPPGAAAGKDDSASGALIEELKPQKVKQLKARARELGVGDAELDDADDADDVKQAVIALIVDRAGAAHDEAQQALHAELQAMKVSALKKRAAEAEVDAEAIADADDADDPKAEVIRLIVEAEL